MRLDCRVLLQQATNPMEVRRVQISVTDLMGGRHVLRGLEGENLAVLLAHHGDELGGTGKLF